MRGGVLALVMVGSLVLAGPASAQFQGYDGSNPFDCVLQQAGYGTTFPDPNADPFCVEYDKQRQNVTELGVGEFLAQEPARAAAAGPKCFYYQRDHWRGSVEQGNPTTETYNWDGGYFFDKARGTGGTYVENFTVANQTGDPRQMPGFPEEYKPFFGAGRGGVQRADSGVEVEQRCVELAKRKNPYAKKAGGPLAGGGVGCLAGHGSIARGVPGARLGASRGRVLGALGRPARTRRGFLRYCLVGDGKLMVGFPLRRGRSRALMVVSTAPAFDLPGVAAGDTSVSARRALRGERTLVRRRRAVLLAVRRRTVTWLVRLRAGRVHYVASARRGLPRRSVLRLLARTRAR